MPTAIDARRLRDGARALEVSDKLPTTIAEARQQIDTISDGIAALQSLDDLGPEANKQAFDDQRSLWKRLDATRQQLQALERKEPL